MGGRAVEQLIYGWLSNQGDSKDKVVVHSHSSRPFVCHFDQQIQANKMTEKEYG